MGSKIDIEDLLDSGEVSRILGLANPNGISVYRKRYTDFPAPAIEKGRCLLWLRSDIERWARSSGRLS